MLSFLLEEGVLSVAAVSGIFTASLLGSFKGNIMDPLCESILPSRHLDKDKSKNTSDVNKSEIGDTKNILDVSNTKSEFGSTKIKWQTFTKDLILWLIIMFILYLIWKKLIKGIVKKGSV